MSSEDTRNRSQSGDLGPSDSMNTAHSGFQDFENRVVLHIGGENPFPDPVDIPEDSEVLQDQVVEQSNSASDSGRDDGGNEDPTTLPQPSGDHVVPSGILTLERQQISHDHVVPTGFLGATMGMYQGGLEIQASLVPRSRKQKLKEITCGHSKEASSGVELKTKDSGTKKLSGSDRLASLFGNLKIDNTSKVAKRQSNRRN